MIGYPFDSKVTYDELGTPIYDRAISSLPLRKLIHSLFSDGVLPNPSTNLQVMQGDGMNVIVNQGFAIVQGCMKLEETSRTLAVQSSSATYDRIDTVVLRLNDDQEQRTLDLAIHEGTPASNPIRPDLTRTGSIYEIGLADLYISKNTATISPARITDTRYETSRCGIISSISQFDTTTLYNQIQSDLAGFKEEEQTQFMDWFNNLVYVLDGDVAGHLQNEIDATNTKIGSTPIPATLGDSITGAIVSLNDTIDAKLEYLEKVPTNRDGIYYSKFGNIVNVYLSTSALTLTIGSSIAKLPAPAFDVDQQIWISSGNASASKIRCRIGVNGDLKNYDAMSNFSIRDSFTYICK
ncbi:MAG: hypothetical protein MJZ34_13535 [Paludibacteraceae bacterium]|nr:hypothetical protein [Paludibacteraceae bacterium]